MMKLFSGFLMWLKCYIDASIIGFWWLFQMSFMLVFFFNEIFENLGINGLKSEIWWVLDAFIDNILQNKLIFLLEMTPVLFDAVLHYLSQAKILFLLL